MFVKTLIISLFICFSTSAQIIDSSLVDSLYQQEGYGVGYSTLYTPEINDSMPIWWVVYDNQLDSLLVLRDYWFKATKNLYISPVADSGKIIGVLFLLVPEGSPAWIEDLTVIK